MRRWLQVILCIGVMFAVSGCDPKPIEEIPAKTGSDTEGISDADRKKETDAEKNRDEKAKAEQKKKAKAKKKKN